MKPRLALVIAVGSALVLIALAARGESPVRYGERPVVAEETPAPTAKPVDPFDVDVGGSTVGGSFLVLTIVLVVVAVGVVALVISFGVFRHRQRRGVGVAVDAPDLEDGRAEPPAIFVRRAAEALDELRDQAGPPGDAVIAAWLSLERAAEDSGVPRQDHQTPTEFTGDLLRRYEVDEGAAGTLKLVYQRARFGTAAVTAADARTATEALERIVRDLR
ncbi:DUF4129 domain-containing protein [Saccharothrix sp. NRRL B-16314]|uniref:DUF4129 domain-containing protein n=1 Tax=Saccharothrix sp. NRRL B-16314 TaxID=1463825 RepID=UPI000689763B|nr:DUF4129 domain-containing protein [Saccharothrix sp. NRRL B-16314]